MATLLSINSYFYRRDGSEAVFLDQNRLLIERGWRVVPFSMHHPKNLPSEWNDYFVTEVEFGSEYSAWEKLRRVPKVVYSLEARRQIAKLIEKVHPDVAHCHSIYHHISPSILGVLRRSGVPTIMTLHDLKVACPAYHMYNDHGLCERCKPNRVHNVLRHRCIKGSLTLSTVVMIESVVHRLLDSYRRNVDLFISPCRFYIDKLVEWGWPREAFIHVPNFVAVPPATTPIEAGHSLLYFGRLSAEKGLMTLVRAAAEAGVPLRFAGSGPLEPALRAAASEAGVDATFLGHLNGGRLTDEIRQARVTILPSEWYENAPMSILESYALGTPVIGADIGGIPELIEYGVTGWTFPSGSIEELARLLRQVMTTPDAELRKMGVAARSLAEGRYSERAYIERLTGVYERFGVQVGRIAQ